VILPVGRLNRRKIFINKNLNIVLLKMNNTFNILRLLQKLIDFNLTEHKNNITHESPFDPPSISKNAVLERRIILGTVIVK
jgi:hypothetical protein